MRTRLSLRPAIPVCLLLCVIATPPVFADDWPQWLGPRRDSVWRESGIVDRFPEGGPRHVWRVPVGPGYAGPAVAKGRVYLMDRQPVRDRQGNPVANTDGTLPGSERVLCYRSSDGKLLWKREYERAYRISYPAGPRTTPIVSDGRVYTLGAMGDLYCLRAADGSVVWNRRLAEEYKAKAPVWGYAAHLQLDGNRLITLAGGKGAAVIALDKRSGTEIWRSLTAQEVGYAPPVLHEVDGVRQLLVWLDTAVYGLVPETGKKLWSVPFPENGRPKRPAVPIMTPVISDGKLLVSDYYQGSMLAAISTDPPSAKVLWRADEKDQRHHDGLNVLMATPFVENGHIYGNAGDGELRCLDIKTGKTKWRTVAATGKKRAFFATVFLIKQAGRFFLWNDQGELLLARLSPAGYQEIDRAKLLQPTGAARGRKIVWSHPAFAEKSMFARNDKELIRVNLEKGASKTLKPIADTPR